MSDKRLYRSSVNYMLTGVCGGIAEHFNMTKPSISHHLSVLKNSELVLDERQGQNIIYSLNMTIFQDLIRWFFNFKQKEQKGKEDSL